MTFRPAHSYLLVTVKPMDRNVQSGIIIPDQVADAFPYCEVLAKGPKCSAATSIGDRVLCLPQNLIGLDPITNTALLDEGAIFCYIDEPPALHVV